MTEAHVAGVRGATPRYPIGLLIFFLLLMALLHVPAFSAPHEEGDEMAYLALAQQMGWDLSNYTTRNDPVVRWYPYSIYRQELFHQPPLYPLVLKLGMTIGATLYVGLGFQVLAMAMLLIFARRAAMLLRLPEGLQAALYSALVLCPLLLFSTTRLHHDGLLGIFLFCAFMLYIEALDEQSLRKALVSGVLFVMALNVRYNAIAALPLLLVVQAFHLYRQAGPGRGRAASDTGDTVPPRPSLIDVARDRAQWKCFGVVMLLVATLGLPHYYRVLATYGSLDPSSFIVPAPNVEQWSDHLRRVHERTRLQTALYLIAIFPMVLTWLSPSQIRRFARQLRERSWALVYPTAALFLFSIHFIAIHSQIRYYAIMTPFLLTGFAVQIDAAQGASRQTLWKWAGLTLLLMFISGISAAIFQPAGADVVPSVFFLMPFLHALYT